MLKKWLSQEAAANVRGVWGPKETGCGEAESQMGCWEPEEVLYQLMKCCVMLWCLFFWEAIIKRTCHLQTVVLSLTDVACSDRVPRCYGCPFTAPCTCAPPFCVDWTVCPEGEEAGPLVSPLPTPPSSETLLLRVLSGYQRAGQTSCVWHPCPWRSLGHSGTTKQAHCCQSEIHGNRPVIQMKKGSDLLLWAILTGPWSNTSVSYRTPETQVLFFPHIFEWIQLMNLKFSFYGIKRKTGWAVSFYSIAGFPLYKSENRLHCDT